MISVQERLGLADYFVLVTGLNRTHVRALQNELHVKLKALGERHLPIEGAELSRGRQTVARSNDEGVLDAETELAGPLGRNSTWTVTAQGYASAERWIQGGPDATVHFGTIVLARGADVAGRVTDDEGRAIRGAEVYPCTPAAFPAGATAAERARTDDMLFDDPAWWTAFSTEHRPRDETDGEGHFLLRGLPEGEHFLVAMADGHQHGWTDLFRVEPGEARELVLVLPRIAGTRRTEGIVLDPDGRPVPNARVRVLYGPDIWSGRLAEDDGRFDFIHEDWREGTSFVREASDPEYRWTPARLDDVRFDAAFVELRLGAPDWLVVRLEDTEHRPIPWGHASTMFQENPLQSEFENT